MMQWPWKRREDPATETRASNFTAEVMVLRESYLSGVSGLSELTATTQGCVTLWESAFALADVLGTDLLDRRTMAMVGRSAALRGEALLLIRDRLIPCTSWDVATRNGDPVAYRVTVAEATGSRQETALAGEVIHLRLGIDPAAPWIGQAPLRRSGLSASLLEQIETALRDVYQNAPLGSQIVHLPEGATDDMATMRKNLLGRRGAALVVEGVAAAAAAGMAPNLGKAPDSLTPDLQRAMVGETLDAARGAICWAFGVLPGMLNPATTGPLVREGQRHLAGWVLQPVAELLAEEASAKLGGKVVVDIGRPLQAFDAGGRARALSQLIEAMGRAKELGLTPDQLGQALTAVNWGGGDTLA